MGTAGDPRGSYFPCSAIESIVSVATNRGFRAHFLNFTGIFLNSKMRGGCGHPSARGHTEMADIAEPILRSTLGWDSEIVV